jgi:hypothetical protein
MKLERRFEEPIMHSVAFRWAAVELFANPLWQVLQHQLKLLIIAIRVSFLS